MTGQMILLLSDHASYMTGQEYFVDGYVDVDAGVMVEVRLILIFWFSGQQVW